MIFKDINLSYRWASFIKGFGWNGLTANMSPVKVGSLPDWQTLLDTNRSLWNHAKRKAQTGPKILMATSVGGFSALSMVESVLAVALTLRGAQVHTLLCDKILPACLRAEKPEIPDPEVFSRYELPKVLCDGCFNTGQFLYGPLGLQEHAFNGLLNTDEKDRAKRLANQIPFKEIAGYRFENWSVGEHAYAGALRYFASGNLDSEPYSEMVVRR